VPKAIVLEDDDRPRRRRGAAAAVAVEETAERGLVMRMLLHSPKDMVAGMIAAAAVIAIISNALFMQAGRHPSPMFGGSITPTNTILISPLPRPRPAEADVRLELKPVESRSAEIGPVGNKPAEPLANLMRPQASSSVSSTTVPRPPRAIPVHSDPLGDLITSSRRVAAVQRALTEYGYGQLKPTGTVGSDTQAAIQKFERDRKIPVTGQMSDRLVRELSAMTGKPIE
jgi:hypothetical protein